MHQAHPLSGQRPAQCWPACHWRQEAGQRQRMQQPRQQHCHWAVDPLPAAACWRGQQLAGRLPVAPRWLATALPAAAACCHLFSAGMPLAPPSWQQKVGKQRLLLPLPQLRPPLRPPPSQPPASAAAAAARGAVCAEPAASLACLHPRCRCCYTARHARGSRLSRCRC